MARLSRAWFTSLAATIIAGCGEEPVGIGCMIPTYDLPDYTLAAVEARHLASICTESWAKRWAVKTKESAGDVAEATTAKCMSTYSVYANAEWPREVWGPGAGGEKLPDIVSEWRREAVRQVIETREEGCNKLTPLPKYQWPGKSPQSVR